MPEPIPEDLRIMDRQPSLTRRERQILALIAEGLTN